jgi:hypothetical protein
VKQQVVCSKQEVVVVRALACIAGRLAPALRMRAIRLLLLQVPLQLRLAVVGWLLWALAAQIRPLRLQARSGLAQNTSKHSPRVVDEHAVHALLDGVEEADGLAIDVDDHAGVPAVGVLVIPGVGRATGRH